ncbi:MAG: hypothetical protein HUU16_02135 [Candidatus Omnitrophica bacterium]|nr:hypothetical protein [bacterium]NUN94949.1 hypothetical protein [Candidatus Omnitrophota bacterium]
MSSFESKLGARDKSISGAYLCLLAAIVMAYGWGYRGVVGHEGGAMAPGAMLGLALCLGSGRADWRRRAAVVGLCGAVGWAWGGSLSYMEQTAYTVTDSFPDVLYGYTMLFFLGGLWAGIGGAILGLAFTLPRSALERLAGPLAAISSAFLLTYLYHFMNPEARDLFERYTAEHFHDADWLPASIVIVASALYWAVRPKEREEAALFLACGVAWWVGYLGFTKFGGLSLGPPYRSEGWGGVVGILAVLLLYLIRQRNRAALMLCLYGVVGGGLAFALAVFVRHPIRVSWGPFEAWGGAMQWKIAEESFGLFMGFAIALGALRLARGGLAPATEDTSRVRLDLFAVFVILVAIPWINLRRAPMAWIERYQAVTHEPVAGLAPWVWFLLVGLTLSTLALYALARYARGKLPIAPDSAYGKGAAVLLLLVWVTVVGAFVAHLPGARGHVLSLEDISFVALAAILTVMVLSRCPREEETPAACTPYSDPKWNVGRGHALTWVCVPLVLIAITSLSMAMQEGAASGARKRFGSEAYWRLISQIVNRWELLGVAREMGGEPEGTEEDAPARLEIRQDRSVMATLANGAQVDESHTWQHMDSLVWLEWHGREPSHPDRASLPMTLREGRLYIPTPEKERGGYWVYGMEGN